MTKLAEQQGKGVILRPNKEKWKKVKNVHVSF